MEGWRKFSWLGMVTWTRRGQTENEKNEDVLDDDEKDG